MVEETERKTPSRPRAPHKDGCQCAVCQAKRDKTEVAIPAPAPVTPVPPVPSIVLASSLKPRDKFEFSGQTYMAGMKEADFVYAANIGVPGAALLTLGLNAKVKLIK